MAGLKGLQKPSRRSTPAQAWTADIGLRLRRHLALKLAGVTGFTWLFFIGYFHLLRNPVHPVVVMPVTPLDAFVPFVPQALFVYLSLWFYVGIAPGLQRSFAELLVYGIWIGALCLSGLAAFHFWPTQVPPMALDTSRFPGFAMLQGVDAAGNACPSMHVAVAMFTAVRIDDVLRNARTPAWLRGVNGAWLVAIAFSTVTIRQHVVLDVVAGAVLGLAFVLPSMRWRPAGARRIGADIILDQKPQVGAPAGTTTGPAP